MKTFGLDLVFMSCSQQTGRRRYVFSFPPTTAVSSWGGGLARALPGISCCPDVCVTPVRRRCPGAGWRLGFSRRFLALLQCSLSTVSRGGSRSRIQRQSWARGGRQAPRKAAALGKRPVVELSFSFQLGFCESPVRKGASPETPSFPDRLASSPRSRSFPERPASSLRSALETRSAYFSA